MSMARQSDERKALQKASGLAAVEEAAVTDFDVLVIGSGTAAQSIVPRCAEAGLRVAVVDRLPYGGTCARRGCDPKKVLLAAAEAVSRAAMLADVGLVGRPAIDWPALMKRKRTITEPVAERVERWLAGTGAETLHGDARVVGRDEIEVGGRRLSAAHIVVATGARPMPLQIEGEELVTTSDEFLELDALPERVAFIGGGYISFEFAWLARMAGADVTVLHRSSRVLKDFDAELAAVLVDRYRHLGVRVLTEAPVTSIRQVPEGLSVQSGAGEVVADLIVHGAGRMADVDDLGLAKAGVEFGRRGVHVDAHLRSIGNPHVWAAGDAADAGAPLTPVASRQGKIVAAGILGEDVTFDGRVVPSVVFSDPPLASVGMSTEEAAALGDGVIDRRSEMGGWFTQRRLGHSHAGAAIVSDASSGSILGAHLLGANADELINVFALAIRQGVTTEDLLATTWAYPTATSDIAYLM
jgi:glutathione reductase (NADPH)